MRLSEREKKYVLLLVVMLLLAALYYFYTAAVEPFLQHKAEVALQLAEIQQQEMLQQTKLKRLDTVKDELEAKTQEAMVVVEPFYPALPQDRLMLLMQDLVLQSGLEVASLQFSGSSVMEPGMAMQAPAEASYPLKDLAFKGSEAGAMAPAATPDPNAPPADGAQGVGMTGQYAVPQAMFTVNYSGTHAQVVGFIQACESLGRTVAVTSLNETKGEDDLMTGTLSVAFHAVEKPVYDPFLDWTLEKGQPKADLFAEQYAEPVEESGEPVVATP